MNELAVKDNQSSTMAEVSSASAPVPAASFGDSNGQLQADGHYLGAPHTTGEQGSASVGSTTVSTRDDTTTGLVSSESQPTVSTSCSAEDATSEGGLDDAAKKKKKAKKEKKDKKEKKHRKEKKHHKKHRRKERTSSEAGDESNSAPTLEDSGVCSIPLSATDELEPAIPSGAHVESMPHALSDEFYVPNESDITRALAPEKLADMLTDVRKKPPPQAALLDDSKPPATNTRRDSNTRIDSSKTAGTESSTIPTTSSSSREQVLDSKPAARKAPVSLASIMAEQEAEREPSHEGETEEDRMLQMAMELSLKDYEQHEQYRSSTNVAKRRATEPIPRVPRRGSRGKVEFSLEFSDASSHQSGMSGDHSGSHEATEVVVGNPFYGETMHRSDVMSSFSSLRSGDNSLDPTAKRSPRPKRRSEPGPRESLDEKTRERLSLSDKHRHDLEKKPVVLVNNAVGEDSFCPDSDRKDAWFDDKDPKNEWFADYAMSTFHKSTQQEGVDGNEVKRQVPGTDEQQPINDALTGQQHKPSAAGTTSAATQSSIQQITASGHISMDEAIMIEQALREADKLEYQKNFNAALRLQGEEAKQYAESSRHRQQATVRTMTREEFELSQSTAFQPTVPRYDGQGNELSADSGFRMNASRPSESWSRRDRDTVVGPDREVRTKHDIELQARSNAHRLGLDDDVDAGFIGNKAFNSFKRSMQRQTVKGVAAHGHGRAAADTDRTSGGMDLRVRHHIAHAINNGLIDKCNGIINEGKEAVIYHAKKGNGSDGFDVAIKVFKRIQEFKGRGMYVDGDPRYEDGKFRSSSSREQLELWAEKEYRNLLRANRAGVPVPTPLLQKENVIFMRFLGEGGWAVPQLKELKLRQGSSKWSALYSQVMIAMRRLFHGARLVHGDLSEYNILVSPAHLVANYDDSIDPNDDHALQAVLIDFGQAVDRRHPSAINFLQRDLEAVRSFFNRMGTKTLEVNMAQEFITSPETDQSDVESLSQATENSVKEQAKKNSVASSGEAVAMATESLLPPVSGEKVAPGKSWLGPKAHSEDSSQWGSDSLDSTEWTANFDDAGLFKKG